MSLNQKSPDPIFYEFGLIVLIHPCWIFMRSFFRLISYALLVLATAWLLGCAGVKTGQQAGVLPSGKPKQIALLLPLQGANASSGQAIRNGFLTAYYYAKQQQADAPGVTVVDTSSGDIVGLYQQAVAKGADFIVGPLTKENLQTLASHGALNRPTLALNTLDNGAQVGNLYQFGLSPQEEASQAAIRAKNEGHQRAIIMYPKGAWGQGIASAFQNQFQSSGGTVVASYPFVPREDFSVGVAQALGVDPAAKRLAHPREDIDMVFLVAFPQEARQIRPQFLFYNAGSLPIYATSLIYSGTPNPQYDTDLNGIQFGDMPWVLGPDMPQWGEMRDHIKTLWGPSYAKSPRLYALGIDAYHLTYRLSDMGNNTLTGATGVLSVGGNQYIQRQLSWATVQNGVPQPLP